MTTERFQIKGRLDSFLAEMDEALRTNLRNKANCQLVVVTKRHPVSVVQEAYDCGQRHFGESQAQEGVPKAKALPEDTIWHFIGHLQKNKVRKILQHFDYVHSVDSWELLERVNRIAAEERVHPKVFLQVNLLGIPGRFGFSPKELPLALERLGELDRVDCIGLMGIPPLEADISAIAYFEKLKLLRDQLKQVYESWPGKLSMGMSHDFKDAIAMGSNFLRVGTRIVGERT